MAKIYILLYHALNYVFCSEHLSFVYLRFSNRASTTKSANRQRLVENKLYGNSQDILCKIFFLQEANIISTLQLRIYRVVIYMINWLIQNIAVLFESSSFTQLMHDSFEIFVAERYIIGVYEFDELNSFIRSPVQKVWWLWCSFLLCCQDINHDLLNFWFSVGLLLSLLNV